MTRDGDSGDPGTTSRSHVGEPVDFAEYRNIVSQHLENRRIRYYERSQWNRRLFRASGVLVILTSSALPVLACFEYVGKDVVLAVVGVSIAALTGLRSFYRWDEMWALLRKSDLALSEAHALWDLELLAAAKQTEPAVASERAFEATKTFLGSIHKLREQESDNYFEVLSFPDPSSSQAP